MTKRYLPHIPFMWFGRKIEERNDIYESRKSVENYNASNCRINRIFRRNKRKIKREGDDCYDKKIFTTYSIIIVDKRKVVKDEKKT